MIRPIDLVNRTWGSLTSAERAALPVGTVLFRPHDDVHRRIVKLRAGNWRRRGPTFRSRHLWTEAEIRNDRIIESVPLESS